MYPYMYISLHVKCLLLWFNFKQVVFSRQILLHSPPHYKISRNSVKQSRGSPCEHTDRQTHKFNEANSETRTFLNAPKKAVALAEHTPTSK